MVITDRIRFFIAGCLLVWLGLLLAPAVVAADELRQVEHPAIDFLFTADELADEMADKIADGYGEIYLEPVSVWYPKVADADSADKLRRQAVEHLDNALTAYGLTRVAEPNERSVIARIQYIDLTASSDSAETLALAQQFRFRVKAGRITMVAELYDAETGDVLLRLADLQDSVDVGVSVAEQVDLALRQWSGVIAASLRGVSEPRQLAARQ